MIATLPEVITEDELAQIRRIVSSVEFIDGKATAGGFLQNAKNNQQIPWDHPAMKNIAGMVMRALERCDGFMSAAQPRKLAAMLVSRYLPGMSYGFHVDAPLMMKPNHIRSDVSFTLFLNEPGDYAGGELAFAHGGVETAVKLPARSVVCYPTGQLHCVRPIESGERLVVVGWVQSLVRDAGVRELLYDLSEVRDRLAGQEGMHRALELVVKSYSNLLRRHAEP